MKKPLILLLAIPFLISSCGEFAYKRGAGANDLATDKRACEARINDHKMIEQCLSNKGWTVQKLDDMDPFATASVNPDNRVISPDPNTYTKNTTLSNDNKTESAAQPLNGIPPNSETSATPTPIADPLDKFIISSWWKIGGNASSLQDAISECVATLGEAHRPNPITNAATRGLGVCMKDKGWRGLKAQK
jgi:hypothetical protein